MIPSGQSWSLFKCSSPALVSPGASALKPKNNIIQIQNAISKKENIVIIYIFIKFMNTLNTKVKVAQDLHQIIYR